MVLTVQSGGRSIQVTVTDRGPFTGAFLDLSPEPRARSAAAVPIAT
ncbi:hypothetical protein [Bradyrhizobium sp. OAE829]